MTLQAGLAPGTGQQIASRYQLAFTQFDAIDFGAEVANLDWLAKLLKCSNQCVAEVRSAVLCMLA